MPRALKKYLNLCSTPTNTQVKCANTIYQYASVGVLHRFKYSVYCIMRYTICNHVFVFICIVFHKTQFAIMFLYLSISSFIKHNLQSCFYLSVSSCEKHNLPSCFYLYVSSCEKHNLPSCFHLSVSSCVKHNLQSCFYLPVPSCLTHNQCHNLCNTNLSNPYKM